MQTCRVTRTVTASRFQSLRTGDLSACLVTQTATDGYSADCTGRCMTAQTQCRMGTMTYSDTVITCPFVPNVSLVNASLSPCDWQF